MSKYIHSVDNSGPSPRCLVFNPPVVFNPLSLTVVADVVLTVLCVDVVFTACVDVVFTACLDCSVCCIYCLCC